MKSFIEQGVKEREKRKRLRRINQHNFHEHLPEEASKLAMRSIPKKERKRKNGKINISRKQAKLFK
jgi:hypothetical protein